MINIREQSDSRLQSLEKEVDGQVREAVASARWDARDKWLQIYKEVKYELLRRHLDEYYVDAYSSQRYYTKDEEEKPIPREEVNRMKFTGFR